MKATRAGQPSWRQFKEQERAARQAFWRAVLAHHDNSIAKAAEATGIHRSVLYRKLETLGIARPEPKTRHGNRGNSSWRDLARPSA